MTKSRINTIFKNAKEEHRSARILFASAGFPNLTDSETLINALIENGADIIELGIPFSDPIADGPIIQKASQIALGNGANLISLLEMAGRIRRKNPNTGLIVFSYLNPILAYGTEKFCKKLEELDIDGVLIVDLPLEERDEFKPLCDKHNLHFIPLISPATDIERAKKVINGCSGFVYTITVRGITGARSELPKELSSRLDDLHRITDLPIAAGFGISSKETVDLISKHADGVVIGSAAIRSILDAENIMEALENETKFMKSVFE